jgi:hypothetical protein
MANVPVLDDVKEVVIPAGEQFQEDFIDLGGNKITAIYMPTSWTAANIEIHSSPDNIDPYQLNSEIDGTRHIVSAEASIHFGLPASWVYPFRFIKLKSSVAQASERIIKIGVRPI